MPDVDHSIYKLGKSAPRIDTRTLKMAKYVGLSLLESVKPSVDWSTKVADWTMMANDIWGDCAEAAPGHGIMGWTSNTNRLFVPTTQQIVQAYRDITGFDPDAALDENGNNPTDQGSSELDVLKAWRKQGIAGRQIIAFAEVDPKVTAYVKLTVDLFGGSYIGVALPLTAQTQEIWDVVPNVTDGMDEPGSWGGHAVWVIAYDAGGVWVITWGKKLYSTWSFFQKYCLAQETKVLKHDLTWGPVGDLKVGDELVGFDEHGPRRRMRKSIVESCEIIKRPCYDIFFEDGTKIRSSSEHLWLCQRKGAHWVSTKNLRYKGGVVSKVIKPLDVWRTETDYDAGYLAAAFDGEGCLTQRDAAKLEYGAGDLRLTFAQKKNPMLEKVLSCLDSKGYKANVGIKDEIGMVPLSVSRRREIIRFLGSIRPARLLPKFNANLVGGMSGDASRYQRVVDKVFVGECDVVALKTSTHTLFAEGFASHNCDECWAVFSDDWLIDGKSPENFDANGLKADLGAIGQVQAYAVAEAAALTTATSTVG